jgi:hypothetical protein
VKRGAPLPARYTTAKEGGLYSLGPVITNAAALREQLDTIETIENATRGAAVVAADVDHSLEELTRLAKNLVRAKPAHVLSAIETPGASAALERGGAHVWRVRGADGVVFASKGAPAYSPRLAPLSKHADFAKPPTRPVKLLRKDAGEPAAADPQDILPEAQIVYGIVLEPQVVDSQGDIYSANEVESACHLYLENFQEVGHMHQTILSSDSARVVESYIAPCDFEMGGQAVIKGSWVIALHIINDDLWAQIKGGDLTGFSIGGWAQRVPIAGDPEAVG